MEGILLLILIGALIVEFLVMIGIIVWEIFCFLADKFWDWIDYRDKMYKRKAQEWFEKGNRIWKTKKNTFILTWSGGGCGAIGVYCNSEKCYKFNLCWHEIGRITSKTGFLFLSMLPLKKCLNKIRGFDSFERVSKEKFIDELINCDSYYDPNICSDISHHVFSFDIVDMSLLPDWVTTELVAKKLEES